MLPHAPDVVSNTAMPRTSLPHLFSDLVQPSRGSPRVFVAPPGSSSILLAPALTTIFVYPNGDQLDATSPSSDNDEDGDERSVQPFADLGSKPFPLTRTDTLFVWAD
jgi:hypothetical protein